MYFINKKLIKILKICTVIAVLQSCSQKSDPLSGHGEKMKVHVSLTEALYEEVNDLSRAATPYLTDPLASSPIQRGEEVQLDDDLYMTAELIPLSNKDTISTTGNASEQSLKDGSRAAAEVTPLTPGVRYRLLVYAANETYVTEREYEYGQEESAEPLLLDGGSQYIFIAYSLNTTVAPPAVTFTGGAQTLAASNVSIDGSDDFMYFRQEMTISAGSTNNLAVILRHRMSQITTTINATSVAYPVNTVSATFSRHQPAATVPLSTGLPTRSGTIGTRAVTFNLLGTQSVTSTPTIINAATNSLTNFVISSIQIGSITRTNLTPFSNLTVTPGVKYNLVLNITPNDVYLTHMGRPAARINGKIWLRHNIGVTTTHNADNFGTNNQHLIGNYYQWGKDASIANGSTGSGAITPWSNATPSVNAWSSTYGPCPSSFNLPDVAEVNALFAATVASNIGNWNSNSATNFTAAKVLTSRRNANVKLTFPIAGWRSSATGALGMRGNSGFYWMLGAPANDRRYDMCFTENNYTIEDRIWRYGFNIRCTSQ